MIKALIASVLLALIFTTSVVAGYPRENSSGPYKGKDPIYVSDYDLNAMEFIKEKAKELDEKPFIIGDSSTNFAAVTVLGYQTRIINDIAYPLMSYYKREDQFNQNSLWNTAMEGPFALLLDGLPRTAGLSKTSFLILTYRLPQLSVTAESYMATVGEPVYFITDKVYVFQLSNEDTLTRSYLGNEVARGLWHIEPINRGNRSFTMGVDNDTGSLSVVVGSGEYQRATLVYQLAVPEDWSGTSAISFTFDGMASRKLINIVIRGESYEDFYYYTFRDTSDAKTSVIIPMRDFSVQGSPSTSDVRYLMVQLFSDWPQGELEFADVALLKS